ncbi:MAG: putative zinc-binding protein [Candidatus Latescibacterota bacterium]
MEKTDSCQCSEAPKLIFVCSGGADVGEIADRAGRKLAAEGVGKMYCLAGIGGHVSGILKTTESAAGILAIDGCPVDCARKSLEHAGFSSFTHLRISDMGIEKGKSPATEERVEAVTKKGKSLFCC